METRIAELEAELRTLKKTVAALAPALAENVLRELTARGALLVVKTPREEMAEVVTKSVARAVEENTKSTEEENMAATAAANNNLPEVENMRVEKETNMVLGEENKLAEEEREKQAPAVVEDDEVDEASDSDMEVAEEEDEEEKEEEEVEDQRMDVETSQESAASGSSHSSVSDSSDVGEAPTMSLRAFEDAVSSRGGASLAPPLPPTQARVPSRPPVIIPIKNTNCVSPDAVAVAQHQQSSQNKMPVVVSQWAAPSLAPTPVPVSPPAPIPSKKISGLTATLKVAKPRGSKIKTKEVAQTSSMANPQHSTPPQTSASIAAFQRSPSATVFRATAPANMSVSTPSQAPLPIHIQASYPVAPQPYPVPPCHSTGVLVDFEVPTKDSVAVAWEKWCCGDPSRGFPPFSKITAKQIAAKAVNRRLSDLRCAMQPIEVMAQAYGMWKDQFTPQEAAAVFAALEDRLPFYPAPGADGRKRKKEIAWSTALNNMRKKRKQQGPESAVIDQALI